MSIDFIVVRLDGEEVADDDDAILNYITYIPGFENAHIQGEMHSYHLNLSPDWAKVLFVRVLDEKHSTSSLAVIYHPPAEARSMEVWQERLSAVNQAILKFLWEPEIELKSVKAVNGWVVVDIACSYEALKKEAVEVRRGLMRSTVKKEG